MSGTLEKYRKHIDKLGLSDEQAVELIGALQCIAENLLDKKYMLGLIKHHDQEQTSSIESGDLLPRVKRKAGQGR